jgi:DUF4097 and DUF4098 domain-containing protein YvlB
MKPIPALTGLLLAVCAVAFAQDTKGDRIVVPARNSARPRVVNCNLLNGSITVKAYNGNEVIVEGEPRRSSPAPNGMRRIGGDTRGLEVVEDDNVITVHGRSGGNGNVIITVPVATSLRLHTLSGAIDVEGVHGEVEVHTLNGHLTLTHISGTVSADSQNGAINVTMDSVDPGKPLAFSTLNGEVDLTLPPDIKANLSVRTNHATVFSDFEVTLGGSAAISDRTGNGPFRIRMDNTIRGTINGGGVEITIHTFNGAVYIRKKK